jgi:hypothetical protein
MAYFGMVWRPYQPWVIKFNTQLGQYESLRGRAAVFEAYLSQYEKEN